MAEIGLTAQQVSRAVVEEIARLDEVASTAAAERPADQR
jgi:hypothetical protein